MSEKKTPTGTDSGAGTNWQEEDPLPSKETMNIVREVAITPMIAGFFQGFFTVAMRYRREKKAAEKLDAAGIHIDRYGRTDL